MLIFKGNTRKNCGKGANRRLRLKNKCPAVIYGGNEAPHLIEIDQQVIFDWHQTNLFYKKIIKLIVGDKEIIVKVKSVQRHPFKPRLIHIDFTRYST